MAMKGNTESVDDEESNNQSNLTTQTEQPIKTAVKTGLTPKLVRALINKRDYFRSQVKTFQRNFSGFRFYQSTKDKTVLVDENVTLSNSHDLTLASNTECLPYPSDGRHVMAIQRGEGHSGEQLASATSGNTMEAGEKVAMAMSVGEQSSSHEEKKDSVMKRDSVGHDWSHPEGAGPSRPELTNGHKEENVFEDDLPLGSEANNLTKDRDSVVNLLKSRPLVDKRLQNLKESPVFTSFNSDTSAQTSGSTGSVSSLDALLQGRQVDPVKVLMNLGFGYTPEPCNNMMRVPERFLLERSHAAGIDVNDILVDYPELHRLVMKKTATRKDAWRMASKSISSALTGLKTMSAMRAATLRNTTPEIPMEQDEQMTSILHPDNQKALALRGYYSKWNNDKIKLSETIVNAASKREMFSKRNRKSMWSFVESSGSDAHDTHDRRTDGDNWGSMSTDDSKSKTHMMSFSTSMDSSEQSGWISDSHSASASDVFKHFEEGSKTVDVSPTSIGSERKKQVHGLMNNLTDDGEYSVTPVASKQSSLEKVPVIESSPVIQLDPDGVSRRGSSDHHVTIVVHSDPECTGDLPKSPVNTVNTQFQAKVNGTQSLLTIVNAAMERLSDSGSDYTVVGMESPNPSFDTPQNSVTRSDTVFSDDNSQELPPLVAEGSKDGEPHGASAGHLSVKFADENDNYPTVAHDNYPATAEENHPNVAHEIHEAEMLIQKRLENEDLPRMGSVQSDSSGFGDADVSADTNITDANELPRVCSLGSSSESVGTSSNATTLSQQPVQSAQKSSSLPTSDVVDHSIAAAVSQIENHTDNSRSDKASLIYSGNIEPVSTTTGTQKFISWCFIPPLQRTNMNRVIQEEWKLPVTSKSSSEQPQRYVKNKSFTSLPKSQLQPRETTVSMHDRLSPLSANVSMHGKLPSSTARHRKDNYNSSDDNLSGDEQSYSPSTIPWQSSPGGAFSTTYSSAYSQFPIGSSQHYIHSVDFGSKVSLAEESDYSSVAESTASCSNVELLEYKKLVRLINQSSRTLQGKKRTVPRYRAKKPIRDWTTLVRKKRIQEETRLLQHAINKYKTEMFMCETMFSMRHQAAFDDLSQEEREEVDEVQYLWSEIRQQILNTEQLLSARMKGVNTGNDFFSYLSTFNIIQNMIELLKEQIYHQQISSERDDEDEDVADHSKAMPSPPYWPQFQQAYSPWGPPGGSPHPSWGSPLGHEPSQSRLLQKSMEELRGSLIEEMRQEMSRSTQQLNIDMQARDNEIHRLQLELMMKDVTRVRRRPRISHAPLLRPSKQTDV